MRWNLKFAAKSYVIGSMWLVPLFAFLLYMVFYRITSGIGNWMVDTGLLDETTLVIGSTITTFGLRRFTIFCMPARCPSRPVLVGRTA